MATDGVVTCGSMGCPGYALLSSGLAEAADTSAAYGVGFWPRAEAEAENGVRR